MCACRNAKGVVLRKSGGKAAKVGCNNPNDAVAQIDEEGWTENDCIPDLAIVIIVRRVISVVVKGRAPPAERLHNLAQIDASTSINGMRAIFEINAVLRRCPAYCVHDVVLEVVVVVHIGRGMVGQGPKAVDKGGSSKRTRIRKQRRGDDSGGDRCPLIQVGAYLSNDVWIENLRRRRLAVWTFCMV